MQPTLTAGKNHLSGDVTSLLPHYTAPNRSQAWRRAIALSYMSAKSRYVGEGEGPQYFHVQGKTYPGCVR